MNEELEELKDVFLKRKTNLEKIAKEQRNLEKIYGIESEGSPVENIEYGLILNFLRKMTTPILFYKISARVHQYISLIQSVYKSGSTIDAQDFSDIIGRIYDASFWDGYNERKSEELTEIILTEPYSRISKN